MDISTILWLVTSSFFLLLMADAWTSNYLSETAANDQTLLNACTMHLFVNSGYAFSQSSILGALTEASFPGYAAVAMSGATVGSIVGNAITVVPATATFTLSTTGGPYTIYGYYLKDSGGNLIGGGTFPPPGPYVLAAAGDALEIPLTDTIAVN